MMWRRDSDLIVRSITQGEALINSWRRTLHTNGIDIAICLHNRPLRHSILPKSSVVKGKECGNQFRLRPYCRGELAVNRLKAVLNALSEV